MAQSTEPLARVYIAASTREAYHLGDVAGTLYTAEGEALWSHISSGPGWLRSDLTRPPSRADDLAERYPNGFDVIWLAPDDARPWPT